MGWNGVIKTIVLSGWGTLCWVVVRAGCDSNEFEEEAIVDTGSTVVMRASTSEGRLT